MCIKNLIIFRKSAILVNGYGQTRQKGGGMHVRRWLCLVTALLLVIAVTGCADPLTESQPSSAGEVPAPVPQRPTAFAVPFSEEDTLNPYSTGTEANLQLAGLLYDSLTIIDDTFTPQVSLASKLEFTDATHIQVTVRSDAVFSDGTPVQVADVTASYQAARASHHYKALLSNVVSVKADTRTKAITFTLAKADPHAAACLSFPVYKASSVTAAKGEAPIGGGAYMMAQEDGKLYLQRNPHRTEPVLYERIGLRHLPNASSMYYGLASQDVTYYYDDLNTGDIPRVSASSAAVDMNALFFLGVNGAREPLRSSAVRRAISTLVDRSTLASTAYSGWAKAATLPFHPSWSAVKTLTGLSPARNLTQALELLNNSGYGTGAGQKELALELIYCVDGPYRGVAAEFIRSELDSAGIRLTVVPLSYSDYMSRLSAGAYDLYLGEVRLTANMDLSPLFAGGSAGYGVPSDSVAAATFRRYLDGEVPLEEFVTAFADDMPYIPLCWRCGFAAYDRRFSTVTPHGYDPYYGFINWQ